MFLLLSGVHITPCPAPSTSHDSISCFRTAVNFILYDLLTLCPEWNLSELVRYGGTQKVVSLNASHCFPLNDAVALQGTRRCCAAARGPRTLAWLFALCAVQDQASFSSFPSLTTSRFCKESTGCSSEAGESSVWSFINLKISA